MVNKLKYIEIMKHLRSYVTFRNQRINEKVIFNWSTVKFIIEKQVGKSLKSLNDDCKPEDVIKWVKSTILNTKSDSFLLKLPIEEMKASGGIGGSFLPKGYHGISTPVDIRHEMDSSDVNYYTFMFSILDSQYGLLSDPIDIKSTDLNFNKDKNKPENCGLFWLKKMFDKKFGKNQIPYQIVSYMLKSVRISVGKKIKYSKNISSEEFNSEFQEGGSNEPNKDNTNEDVKDEKLAPGLFKTEGPTNVIPGLKEVLVKCGGRDLYKKGMLHPEQVKTFAPIAQKKRLAFYNWFIQSVYPSFTQALNELKELDITNSLKSQGIDTKSGKVIYKVGDKVVYLKKDKTIEDWNKIEDSKKEKLDQSPASDIVATGKITKIEGDNIKIEYKDGEFANKTPEQIIQKIEEEKKDTKEEDKKEEN